MVIVSQTLYRPVIINTNRHYNYDIFNRQINIHSGMSLEASKRRKSPVTLAVTTGYFFSLTRIMRENLSSISSTTYSACIYWSACLRLQTFTNKHCYISSNPNNISRYFLLIRDEIVDERDWIIQVTYSRFFSNFLWILRWVPNDALQNYKRFSYTGAPTIKHAMAAPS